MSPIVPDAVVLRIGELFLKGANRDQFMRQLRRNLAGLLKGLPWKGRSHQGRVILRPVKDHNPEETVEEVVARCQRCFGVASLSPAVTCPDTSSEAFATLAAALADEDLPPEARTFRVTARRSDKRLPYTSVELARIVGTAVGDAIGLPVNLSEPDFVVGVEAGILNFVYTRTVPGPGGLPVGTGAPLLLMLSGGIDSPVAGYLALKRGCRLEALHFHSPPYTGAAARAKVEDLATLLASYGGPIRVHAVPMTAFQHAVREHADRRLTVLLYRRFMLRIACRIAAQRKLKGLVTGESIGQVASQTVQNLACIEAVADRPVLRPLITYDKDETVRLARRIGTYPISIRPHEDSCSLFVPRHPEIYGKANVLERAEGRLPLEELLETSFGQRETLTIGE